MNENILSKAKSLVKDCDYIVDLYDLTFIWSSDNASEVTGFSKKELEAKKVLDIIVKNEDNYRSELISRMTKRQGVVDLVLRRRDGTKILIKDEFAMFDLEGGQYLVGKIVSHKEI